MISAVHCNPAGLLIHTSGSDHLAELVRALACDSASCAINPGSNPCRGVILWARPLTLVKPSALTVHSKPTGCHVCGLIRMASYQKWGVWCHWVGMPFLTICHCQCVERLCQLFATICKVCFYVTFSIENDIHPEHFCPEMNHWALLPVQACSFSEKIECYRKYVQSFVWSSKHVFSNIAHTCQA